MSTISPIIAYRDLRAGIDFLCDAFGFERHALHEGADGELQHVELKLDDAVVMPTDQRLGGTGGVAQTYVVVEDADAHHDRAKAAGARITMKLRDTDYGSREYAAEDPEGNRWYFGTYRPLG